MKKIVALSFLVVVVAACKDDDDGLTVEQYLTASTNGWVFESIMVTQGGQTVNLVNDPDAFEQCELDDAVIFTADQKYSVATNTKCDSSDPDVQDTGMWALTSDKTTLSVISTTDGPIITLTKLSVDDKNIKGEAANIFGFQVTAQVTMKRK